MILPCECASMAECLHRTGGEQGQIEAEWEVDRLRNTVRELENRLREERALRAGVEQQAGSLARERDNARAERDRFAFECAELRSEVGKYKAQAASSERGHQKALAEVERLNSHREVARKRRDEAHAALKEVVAAFDVRPTKHDGVLGLDWDSRPDPSKVHRAWEAALRLVGTGGET